MTHALDKADATTPTRERYVSVIQIRIPSPVKYYITKWERGSVLCVVCLAARRIVISTVGHMIPRYRSSDGDRKQRFLPEKGNTILYARFGTYGPIVICIAVV